MSHESRTTLQVCNFAENAHKNAICGFGSKCENCLKFLSRFWAKKSASAFVDRDLKSKKMSISEHTLDWEYQLMHTACSSGLIKG